MPCRRARLCATWGGEWCRPLPDGRLELIPLIDPLIPYKLRTDAFLEGGPPPRVPSGYEYAVLNGRVATATSLYPPKPDDFGAYTPSCSAILHDTAGILSPHILTFDREPATGKLHLLSGGRYLAAVAARYDDSRPPVQTRPRVLARYGPDGAQRWTVWGVGYDYWPRKPCERWRLYCVAGYGKISVKNRGNEFIYVGFMKKILSLLLALTVLSMILSTGCGSSASTEADAPSIQPDHNIGQTPAGNGTPGTPSASELTVHFGYDGAAFTR